MWSLYRHCQNCGEVLAQDSGGDGMEIRAHKVIPQGSLAEVILNGEMAVESRDRVCGQT